MFWELKVRREVEGRGLSSSAEQEWLRHQENIRRSLEGADEVVLFKHQNNFFVCD
jgi:hypothetical protein